MNYKMDLTKQNQELLEEADVKVENREYSAEEIKKNLSEIGNYIMSQSSKNGDLAKAEVVYMPLISTLQRSIN